MEGLGQTLNVSSILNLKVQTNLQHGRAGQVEALWREHMGFNRGEKAVNVQSNFAMSAFSSSLLCPALEMRRGLSGQQFSYRGSFS